MGAHRMALHAALICGFIPLVRGQVLQLLRMQLPAWLCARIACLFVPNEAFRFSLAFLLAERSTDLLHGQLL